MSFLKLVRYGIILGLILPHLYSPLQAQQKAQMGISFSTRNEKDYISKDEEGWKGFLDDRLDYNTTHRFNMRTTIELLLESERERLVPSELAAKRLRSAAKKSAEQTLREEILMRMTLDDWAEEKVVEPVEEFLEEYVIGPAMKALTYPFRKITKSRFLKISLNNDNIVEDIFTGREEKNQLIDPLNNEGVPGEEHYQDSRLPNKIAFGARPFQGSPYGYATARLGDWYTHIRLSAADIIKGNPRLNEASLIFQTQLDPHEIILSFGSSMPFENPKEPERDRGLQGVVGLSKILVANGRNSMGEAYIEARAGEKEQGIFASFNLRY